MTKEDIRKLTEEEAEMIVHKILVTCFGLPDIKYSKMDVASFIEAYKHPRKMEDMEEI